MPAPPHDPLRLADEHRPRPRTVPQDPGPSPQRKRVVGTAVLAVVSVLLVVWGVLYAFGAGGASVASASDDEGATSAQKMQEGQRRVTEIRSSPLPGGRAQTGRALGGGDGLFKVSLVKTTLTFTSDGPMLAGWVFSGGPGGVKFPVGSLSVSEDVYPGFPHARSAVQVLQGGTYASCTIAVEGKVIKRATVRGVGQVVGCLA